MLPIAFWFIFEVARVATIDRGVYAQLIHLTLTVLIRVGFSWDSLFLAWGTAMAAMNVSFFERLVNLSPEAVQPHVDVKSRRNVITILVMLLSKCLFGGLTMCLIPDINQRYRPDISYSKRRCMAAFGPSSSLPSGVVPPDRGY